MQALPKYESYKDSQIPWLGEIPSHWELKKHKYFMTEKKTVVGKQASDYTLLSLTLKGVIARDMENPQGKFPAEFNTYKIVNPDDLIFCLFDIEETPRTVGLARQHGMITGAYTVMECQTSVSARYLSYFYLYLDTDKKLKPLYTGLRKVIQRDTFMSIKSPLPPRVEQDRIANFLDQKTAEIDEAIAKKQSLIELLKEQKAILINRAVTKGLNPDVAMRDSGVEWIGEVPAHWEISRIGFIGEIGNGSTPNRSVAGYWANGDIPWLNSSKVNDVLIENADQFVTKRAVRECHLPIISPNTIVVGITGEGKTRGMSAITKISATINQHLAYIKVSDHRILPKYLMLYLSGIYMWMRHDSSSNGSTKGAITCGDIKKYKLPVPPVSEQVAIINHVEKNENDTHQLIDMTKEIIHQLVILKNVIISDAVTGKIKI